MYIGIVAGEPSGDSLGADLVKALKLEFPGARFAGIGGNKMEQAGVSIIYSMDRISIMGLDGLLGSFWDILKIRRQLIRFFLQHPPDVFIGIDVPDFNTGLEYKLKKAAIPTVHYVSPTVWAWRGYRIRKIKKSVSHMMTLFPFEAEYYRHHQVPVTFVGHPFADSIPIEDQQCESRQQLGLEQEGYYLAVLPGSRMSELKRLGQLFIDTLVRFQEQHPAVKFLAPFANLHTQEAFRSMLARSGNPIVVKFFQGSSREVMSASDIVLLASGTAALEAALLKKPMVVAYRVSVLTELIVRMFRKVEFYSMPNHLLSEPIIPELIQHQATTGNLLGALLNMVDDDNLKQRIRNEFTLVHRELRQGASKQAARVVKDVCVMPVGQD